MHSLNFQMPFAELSLSLSMQSPLGGRGIWTREWFLCGFGVSSISQNSGALQLVPLATVKTA